MLRNYELKILIVYARSSITDVWRSPTGVVFYVEPDFRSRIFKSFVLRAIEKNVMHENNQKQSVHHTRCIVYSASFS